MSDAEFGETFAYLLGDKILPGIAHFLSLCPAVPLNGFIIYRLSSKQVTKSNYFRLIMFMCTFNICVVFAGGFDFAHYIFDRTDALSYSFPVVKNLFNYNHMILCGCYEVDHVLVLIVLIHWKTVLVKKRRLDIFLYATALTLFCTDQGGSWLLQKFYSDSDMYQIFINVMTYIYFALYSSVAIYCYVVLRRVDTSSYSSPTLKIYKRMTLVHFTQTSLIVGEFLVLYPIRLILTKIFINNFDSKSDPFLNFTFYFGMIECCYIAVKPCIQSIFLFWALRGVLRPQGNAQGGVTATLAAGALRIFARRTVEGAAGTVAATPHAHDPLQDP